MKTHRGVLGVAGLLAAAVIGLIVPVDVQEEPRRDFNRPYFLERGGVRYSHTLDPLTGRPVPGAAVPRPSWSR